MKYDKYRKRYSIVLDEILENYIKAEKKAGREVTQFEINSFDTALCNTIDNIRSVSEDEQVIEESMNNLQQLMKSGNMNIADMPKIATSVTEEVAKEVETKRQISDTVSNIIDTTASTLVNGVVIPVAASTAISVTVANTVDKISNFEFNQDVIRNVDNKITQARNGNEDAAAEVAVTAVMMKKMAVAKHDKSFVENDGNRKALLKRIIDFSVLGGSEGEAKLLVETAKEFGLDVFSLDENGKYALNNENIEKLAGQDIPNYLKRSKEPGFKEHLIARNKRAARSMNVKDKSGQEFADIAKEEAKISVVKTALDQAFRERNEEEISKIVAANPDISKRVLANMIKKSNELIQYSFDSSRVRDIQEKSMVIGKCIGLISGNKVSFEHISKPSSTPQNPTNPVSPNPSNTLRRNSNYDGESR